MSNNSKRRDELMKYTKPSYKNEIIASEDIMDFSQNNISTKNGTFEYASGERDVKIGTSNASIFDLLFPQG